MGAFDDLIPPERLAEDDAFADLVPPKSPTAPSPAPATPLAAPALTPTSGTLPTTVTPALAGSSSGTLPAPVSPETDNAFADLVPPPAAAAELPLLPRSDIDRGPFATFQRQAALAGPAAAEAILNQPRAPEALIGALGAGRRDFTEDEFGALLRDVETGKLTLPETERTTLQLLLSPRGREALAAAERVGAILRESEPRRAETEILPEGLTAFFERFTKGATQNLVDPTRARATPPGPRRDIGRAGELRTAQRQEEHPVAGFSGEAGGSILPFAAGVRLLRTLRTGRGLPAVEETAGGYVAEGAKVGGPQAFLYRPEGAEDMTLEEELAARAVQTGVGLTLGALFDFSAMKVGEFIGHVRRLRANEKFEAQLQKDAAAAGFEDADTYIRALVDIEATPDGVIVRPRAEVLDRLPGETKPPSGETKPPEGETGIDLAARARATPRDETGLELAATEVGDPVTVKRETETVEGIITAKAPDDSPLSPYRYRVRLADGTELTGIAHADVHPTPALIAARRALDAELYPPKGDSEVPAGGEIVPPRASGAAEFTDTPPKPDLSARIAEYERLAGQATDSEVRATLQRQAAILRTEAAGQKPKLTPKERLARARQVDPARDDLITAIRKLGGIDTEVETDYAGRLSHLPRSQFGLPAIERPGKGRTLDDLAEALHERGYLQDRDVRELYDKLDRAAGGETLHSFQADVERAGEIPRPRSSDRDWRLTDEADAEASGGDYILTDEGAILPARPLTLDDLVNLEKEATDAERWFQREAAADEGGAGRDRLPERMGDQAPGRAAEPQPGETAGLPGVEPRNEPRQRLADAEREVAARLRGREDVPPEAGEGDLFSGKAKQTDIEDVAGKPPKPDRSTLAANPFGYALRETARDIGLHPGRSLAAAAAGGVGGATTSEAEPGSAQWWLDVAAGAAAVTVGAQFLRRVNLLGKGSIADNARARIGDYIDNLPLIGRGPQELRDLKAKQQLMQQLLDRQTAEVGKELLERFSPSERAMMADIIETRGIVKDLNVIHRQAQALDDYLVHVTRRMKELGMLPADLAEGGYLHRYYAKHLGLDQLFKEAKGQSLSGSWSLARGTDDVFDRQYFSPGAKKIVDELEQVSADIARLERRPADLLSGDTSERLTTLKARKRELGQIELREFLGHQNGRLRSFLFATDEVGRVETGQAPTLADTTRTPGGRGGQAVELPTAPGVEDLKPTNYIWTVRGTKGKEALLHRDWTKHERQSWGEIEDAGYRYVRGMMESSHDLSLATLFQTVARKADWVSDAPRATGGKDWVFVPDQRVGKNSPLKKYGALAGKYVRPDIWAGIRGYGRNPLRGGPKIPLTGVGVGDAYLAGLNKWKLYKTVYNPVTHFNNSYSNVEMLFMAGYDPQDLGRGLGHLAQGEQSAVWREARDAGLFGTDWTTSLITPDARGNQVLADLAEKLRTQPEIPDAALVTNLIMDLKHWWVGTKQAVAKADGAWQSGAEIAKAMSAPVIGGVKFSLKPVKALARAAQRAYQFEDNVFKMAVYQAARKKGLAPEAAVNEANKFFFNYNDLPPAMKLARDLPLGSPFVSYPYFAIQAISQNVAQNPERVLFLVAAYEAWNYGVLASQGLSPGEYWQTESAEEATSPPWDRGRSLWGARNTVHMPSPEGYRISLARSHALGNPFMAEAGGREKLPALPTGAGFWGSSIFGGNPLHALLDVAVNEDWKGKEIYKPGAPPDEKAQKIAAYLYQAWAPSNIATPGGYQQARVLEGLANDVRKARAEGKDPGVIAPVVDLANRTSETLGFGQFTGLDRADNEIVTRDALLASFGVKLRPIRTEQSVEFESSKREQEKKKAADWYRARVREHGEGRITDAQMAEVDQAFDAALERLDAENERLFNAEAFLKKRTGLSAPE